MNFFATLAIKRKVTTFIFLILLNIIFLLVVFCISPELSPSPKRINFTIRYELDSPMSPILGCTKYTIPIEGCVLTTRGITSIRSITKESSIEIHITVDESENPELFRLKLLENLKGLRFEGITGPFIFEESEGINQEFFEFCIEGLKREQLWSLESELMKIEGVSRVVVKGITYSKMRVLSPFLMVEEENDKFAKNLGEFPVLNIPMSEIQKAEIIVRKKEILPRYLELGERVIKLDESLVKVKWEEEPYRVFFNGREAVLFTLYTKPFANKCKLSRRVREVVEKYKVKGSKTFIIDDKGGDILKEYRKIFIIFIAGVLLSSLSLFLVLKDFRLNLPIILSGIAAVQLTAILMFIFGLSFNIVSLSAITLGFGMFLDASIVFVENLLEKFRSGIKSDQAICDSIAETLIPLFASSITTLIVFVPLIFLGEEYRIYFMPFAINLAIALFSSILTTGLFLPYFLGLISRKVVLERLNLDWLRKIKKFSQVMLFLLSVFVVGSIYIFVKKVPKDVIVQFVPERKLEISIYFPDGATEDWKRSVIESINRFIASFSGGYENFAFLTEVSENSAQWEIFMPETFFRSGLAYEVRRSLEEFLMSYSGVRIILEGVSSKPFVLNPKGEFLFRYTVKGYKFDQLQTLSEKLSDEISKIKYVTKVDPNYVISPISKSETFVGKFSPFDPTWRTILQTEREIGKRGDTLIVYGDRLWDRHIFNSKIQVKAHENEIIRENGFFFNTIGVGVNAPPGEDVLGKVRNLLKYFPYPPGFGFEESKSEWVGLPDEFMKITILSVFLLICIVAATFNSIRYTAFLLGSMIICFCGVVILHFITGSSFDYKSIIGTLLALGVSVNNGIVIVLKGQSLEGKTQDPYINATEQKMHSTLLTTLTTCLAVLPFLFTEKYGLWYKYSLCILGGLPLATVYSGFIMPILLDSIRFGTRQLKNV